MFAVIRRYNVHEGMTRRMLQRVNADFAPLMSRIRGLVAYYAIDGGDNTVATVSVFTDRYGAEESNRVAADWVAKNIARMVRTAPVIVMGEVGAAAMPTDPRSAAAAAPLADVARPDAALGQTTTP